MIDALFPLAAPEATAVALESGDRRRTYGELAEDVRALTAWLRGGAGPVAVLTADPMCAAPALLAALRAEVTYAPLDPAWPVGRLAQVARALRPGAVLHDPGIGPDDPRLLALGEVPRVALQALASLRPRDPAARPPAAASTLFFTSGSTGRPKGILGRPGAIAHFIEWERSLLGVGPGVRVSALAPCSFDASLRDMLLPLSVGGTVCAPPDRTILAEGARLAAWLAAARVEVVHTVPTILRGLSSGAVSLPRLRAVLVAGEVLRPADVRAFFDRLGPSVALYTLYGPTETTMIKLCHRVTRADLEAPSIPLGRPLPDTEVFVVDRAGRPRPPGRLGEIVLRTPWCALGYLDAPEASARAFVPGLLGDGDPTPVYRTGDLGVQRVDGLLEFRGRRDHQVKLRGVRVELEEVEAALAACPGVEAAVAGVRAGPDGEPALVAWIIGAITPAMGDALRARLPAACVPARIIAVEAFPRLLNGKVDRAALSLPPPRSAGAPLAGPIEARVAAIWRELLAVEPGATDDFFELGGGSLSALRAVWRLNEAFGVELPIDVVYQRPTVRGIAALLAEPPAVRAEAPFTLTVLCPGPGSPTFWMPPIYGITSPYRPLAARLGRHALGLDLRTGATSVEALGAAAAAVLRPYGPPWTVAGWSFGGVLAFEVARQLDPNGAQVRLVLMDSAAPTEPFDFAAGDVGLALLAIDRLAQLLGRPVSPDPARLHGRSPEALAAYVLDLAAAHGLPITASMRAEVGEVMATRAACFEAWRRYRPSPWPGAALSLRSAEAPADWTARWGAFVTGELTRGVVAGDHLSMLEAERIDGLLPLLAPMLGGSG